MLGTVTWLIGLNNSRNQSYFKNVHEASTCNTNILMNVVEIKVASKMIKDALRLNALSTDDWSIQLF